MTATLKAYEVRDNYEGHCVIEYATNNATARREGACALDIDWESVESCRRAPQFDEFAPGPVPPLLLLQSGWWFGCSHCVKKVSLNLDDDERPQTHPRIDGDKVFCDESCCAQHAAETRAQATATVALCELVYTWFPDAKIRKVHVHGTKLEGLEYRNGYQVGGVKASADFDLPGLAHGVSFLYGDRFYTSPEDEAALASFLTVDMPPMRKTQAATPLH